MKVLTRDDILGVVDIQRELVEVPEWGGSVYVKMMSAWERDALDAMIGRIGQNGSTQMNFHNIRAKYCALCIVNESGDRLFTEDDIEALGKKSANALDRVVAAAQRLNALDESSLEDIRKNLSTIPIADST